MDVLFVSPGDSKDIYQELSNQFSGIETPIWAGMLAQAVRAKGKEVDIVDLNVSPYSSLTSKLETDPPKLLVLVAYGSQPSASTQTMHSVSKTTKQLKQLFPDLSILFVGGHVSALPQKTMEEEACDYVAKGEGLNSILGLLEGSDLSKVPGLFYRELSEVLKGPPDSAAKDLVSSYPGVAWDLLPMSSYRANNWHAFGHLEDRSSYASIYTSLGCPFKCTFCCINAPFDSNSFRYWEPAFMVREMQKLTKDYGVKNLKIADEMFVLREDHYLKLCDLLAERDLGLNIWAYARVDTIKPKNLERMKKAGINWLALGIESGSKHVRDGVIKGKFGQDDIRKIVQTIKDSGIHVIGNFIYGLPDDTHESMEETFALSVDLNCEMVNYYCAMAYPGSRLYDYAIRDGWQLPESWIGYSQHSYECLPLRTEKLTAAEVLAFRDESFHAYFRGSKYQEMVLEKFGKSTLDHINEMTKIKLKRKLLEPVRSV